MNCNRPMEGRDGYAQAELSSLVYEYVTGKKEVGNEL